MNDPQSTVPPPTTRPRRIASIDALRGFVMLLMLVDHAREFFYLDHQVSDPMDIASTPPSLFFTRLAAHLCAPVFVALTGVAAWLYAAPRGGAAAASSFLARRGLFLVVLELTVVGFAWSFDPTPTIVFLQVIWAIGLSMLALAALVRLPWAAPTSVGLLIVLGHNLLDSIHFDAGTPWHAPWAILHERGFIELPWGVRARTSYPVLPWIGVMALGYAVGPWFSNDVDPSRRRRLLLLVGLTALVGFATLRTLNGYSEPVPWRSDVDPLRSVMSFLNLTKYPPSADFVLITLGLGAWLLAAFEKLPERAERILTVLGGVPLFFYVLHLYALHIVNRLCGAVTGTEGLVSVPGVAAVWAVAAAVAVPCWFACRRFVAVKRASGAWWMRYL